MARSASSFPSGSGHSIQGRQYGASKAWQDWLRKEAPMSFEIRRIDHVVLRVHDMAAMVAFYETALGCVVERTLDRISLVQLRAGDCLLDLVANDQPRSGRNMDHLCFRVDPFDPAEITARLKPFNIEPGAAVDRYGAEGDGPSIYFDDPEGNQIELKGPAHTPARRASRSPG
jgi:glyoxylase I family protein